MSGYLPPVTPGGGAPAPPAQHHEQQLTAQLDEESQQSTAQAQFGDGGLDASDAQRFAEAAAAAAAAAAHHHGLQALQAAVGAPGPATIPSAVTQQYAAHGEPSYLSSSATPAARSPPNPKATRLRRACDMCSQRKVKVRGFLTIAFVRVLTLLLHSSATRPNPADHAVISMSNARLLGR